MTRLRNINRVDDLTNHEKAILLFLKKNGQTHRSKLVVNLASENTNSAQRMNNGSNGAVPLIAAKWCRRLLKSKLIRDVRDDDANHLGFRLLDAGKALIS